MAFKTRDAVLAYAETKTDTETHIEDLDVIDPISALNLVVSCTNGATSNKGNFISDIVAKVEVVDGSDTLISLSGAQLQALEFDQTRRMPMIMASEHPSGGQTEHFNILFGRYLYDKSYALNPARFRKPQLKITFNKAAIRAAGVTGFASGYNISLSVIAKLMEEGASPSAFFMQKQIESWTMAASGDKTVQLPVDYPYRMLLLRSFEQLVDLDGAITDVKLSCDKDRFIPINRKVGQLAGEALSRFGRAMFKHDIFTQHGAAFREINNKENSSTVYMYEDAAGYIVGIWYEWSSEGKLTVFSHAGVAYATDAKYTLLENGHLPHAALAIPFGLLDDPSTWFNAPAYGDIDLILTQGNAGGAGSVVAEQVRPN
jgi:hypothetical protein